MVRCWCCLGILAGAVLALPLWAEAAEVGGFVTQSQGTVTVQSGGKEQPLPAFARLAAGSRISLGEGAKLQIVYLQGGRQESWIGKTELEVGAAESKVTGSPTAPTVKMLPPFMVETLVKSGGVMDNIHARQGMIRVRSLLTAAKVKEAESRYTELRAQTTDDDITPEIFLLTTLDELKAYQSMKKPLGEMLRRQPDNAEAKALHDHFMVLLNTGTVETPVSEKPAGN
jgi:hypothetical protein